MAHHHHDDHDGDDLHDRGLQFDLQTLLNRRRALKLFGGAAAGTAALVVVGCSDSDSGTSGGSATATPTTSDAVSNGGNAPASPTGSSSPAAVVSPIPTTATTPASACVADIPEETAGPFPGDGSNGPNALNQSGIVRSDIRTSFGTSTNTAQGVPLTVELQIVDTAKNCAPIEGAAVYLWHCDREGRYSMYSQGATNENYCRGVQAADANGKVKFTTIFPAANTGRWPHIHFEIYPSLAKATASSNKLATTQLALPDDVCKAVFATSGYEASLRNHAQTTLQSDMVFRDGWSLQMANVTGTVANGYVATLVVGV